jgi:hypothetical protein
MNTSDANLRQMHRAVLYPSKHVPFPVLAPLSATWRTSNASEHGTNMLIHACLLSSGNWSRTCQSAKPIVHRWEAVHTCLFKLIPVLFYQALST